MSDRTYIGFAVKLAKVLFAGFALAVVTFIVAVGLAIAFGWQQSLADFARSPWMGTMVGVATLAWAWVVRKRLS